MAARARALLFAAWLPATVPAHAHELRLGGGYAPHGPEKGASLVLDYVGPGLAGLKALGGPRAYLGTQISLDGYTNYAQGGLLWRWEARRTYLDLGAGVAIHDGKLDLPPPTAGLSDAENDRRRAVRDDRIAFDTRWQFHATFAVGWRLNDRWAIEIEGQHWSNGQLGSQTHDGADSLGLRAAYRF
ncbi:acyloxyacyl hydrolase [Phenylobacterium sp. J367]|uniref:acyloxyacyl hydrolase n=1 Tax=Phenylobacterium sp. J367 TaxID=2898435 RepID=UPI002150B718|nr:acyloxyacyl hydrolase [Phenylobacterium sp. J367]MCR5878734.1 acyloxyacyl hydrolase [Phenylobacterium sp. J367]